MKGWLMILKTNARQFKPAFIALAFLFWATLFLARPVVAQKVPQLPPPPPGPIYKPKPTPTPAPEELDVVRVTSNLIVVPVSVTDANGQPVLGLTANDFRIEEDGRAQQITQLGDPEQVPLDIALLIDVSASVGARFEFEQQAASAFLKQVLKSEDRATVFAIDQTPRMLQTLTTSAVASQSIMAVQPARSFTAFYDSVLAASKYLDESSRTGRRRIIVVISDGDDTARILDASSARSADGSTQLIGVEAQIQLNQRGLIETEKAVQRAEATFYSINPTGASYRLNVRATRAQEGMERMAAATGGAAFVPAIEADLPAIFNRIASEIRSQYLIQYYSDNKSGASTFRRINVTSPARPQLRVRAREGYFPKK
jgi:Ca-activated chloride channel family protein